MEPMNVNKSQVVDVVAEAEATASNNECDDWKNVRSFFLAPAVSANELERATPVAEQAVVQMVQRMESPYVVQDDCQYQSEKLQDRLEQKNNQTVRREQALREEMHDPTIRRYYSNKPWKATALFISEWVQARLSLPCCSSNTTLPTFCLTRMVVHSIKNRLSFWSPAWPRPCSRVPHWLRIFPTRSDWRVTPSQRR
jgi:hypothetical protein